MENTDFDRICQRFSQPGRVLVTTHSNPDGDAIGSCLSLASYLTRKGHSVQTLIPDPFPEFLSWMKGSGEMLVWTLHREACLKAIGAADIIVAADYNNLSRLNEAGEYVKRSQALKVLIDHHLEPSGEFDLAVSISKTSSTSELVYAFMEQAGDLGLLDKAIAECLYAGIITDTGSLSYSCNYVKTYEILAHLFRFGIDGEHLHRLIYDTYSESRLRLLGLSVSDRLVVLPEYHTAFITLTRDDLRRYNYQIGDTEGVVNYALSIKDINLAALFIERDGIVKVSLRSKGNFAVNTMAAKYFDGGGHRNAAGANCTTSLEETVARFLEILPLHQPMLKTVY